MVQQDRLHRYNTEIIDTWSPYQQGDDTMTIITITIITISPMNLINITSVINPPTTLYSQASCQGMYSPRMECPRMVYMPYCKGQVRTANFTPWSIIIDISGLIQTMLPQQPA